MSAANFYTRRPARTSQAERRTSRKIFSEVPLEAPGVRRTIVIRTFSDDQPQIEIAVTRFGERAGIRIIPQADLPPLQAALGLAFDPSQTGTRETGLLTMRSGAQLRFFACREPGEAPCVKIAMTGPTGALRGRPLVIACAELDALARAANSLAHLHQHHEVTTR